MSESVDEEMGNTHSLNNSSTHLPLSPRTHSLTNSSTHSPSPEIAIRVDHVSKKFCRNLRKSMQYGMHDIGRNLLRMSTKPDMLRKDEFWAVDDVSFELHRGETLGIIGANGSGKSTILKMLNGIFMPDKGRIEINGRVGALIEVGAGFHPMLTGRENIYVNGAILGMNKEEMDEKFDDIIEFADIGDFIDTPVKHYSSGMYVRLGFSVAAHCEPEILLVDEVLAVGDITFQARCFNKINNLVEAGTTIVLVSHDLHRIRQYCKRTLFTNNGKTLFIGETAEACRQYILSSQQRHKNADKQFVETIFGPQISPVSTLKDISFKMRDSQGNERTKLKVGEEAYFHFSFFYAGKADNLEIAINIYREDGFYLVGLNTVIDELKISVDHGMCKGILKIERVNLTPGNYTTIFMIVNGGEFLTRGHNMDFSVLSEKTHPGFIDLPHEWDLRESKG
jgi:lipopolysaccharide transport system ATP-binding protein